MKKREWRVTTCLLLSSWKAAGRWSEGLMKSFAVEADSSIICTICLTTLQTETPPLRLICRTDHHLCPDLKTNSHPVTKEKLEFTSTIKRGRQQKHRATRGRHAKLIPVSSERRIKLYNLIRMETGLPSPSHLSDWSKINEIESGLSENSSMTRHL